MLIELPYRLRTRGSSGMYVTICWKSWRWQSARCLPGVTYERAWRISAARRMVQGGAARASGERPSCARLSLGLMAEGLLLMPLSCFCARPVMPGRASQGGACFSRISLTVPFFSYIIPADYQSCSSACRRMTKGAMLFSVSPSHSRRMRTSSHWGGSPTPRNVRVMGSGRSCEKPSVAR